MTLAVRRIVVSTVVVVVLGALAALDGLVGRPPAPALPPVAALGASAVVPVGHGTSAWFCAGGSGPAAGAEETVVVADPTPIAASGTLTAVSSDGRRQTVALRVAPGGSTSVVPAQLVPGAWVSAVVVLDQGGISVGETVSSSLGWSEAPCASTTGTRWLFTGQTTQGSDDVALSVLNPSVTPAVVDIALVTAAGQRLVPPAYQGITVPPSSLVVETLSEHDEGDPSIATVVTAVSGTVVAAELQSSSTSGAHGLAVDLGAPAPSTRWVFPATETIPDGQVTFNLFDPTGRSAVVHLDLTLPGATVAPIAVTVPAGRQVAVPLAKLPQLPASVPMAATFVAAQPIVVSRVVEAPAAGPDPHWGLALGTPVAATTWVLPPATAPGDSVWRLAVVDLAATAVSVTVDGVGADGSVAPAAGLDQVSVQPGAPLVVASPLAPVGTSPVLVEATGDIAVQLDPEPEGAPGVVTLQAEPLG